MPTVWGLLLGSIMFIGGSLATRGRGIPADLVRLKVLNGPALQRKPCDEWPSTCLNLCEEGRLHLARVSNACASVFDEIWCISHRDCGWGMIAKPGVLSKSSCVMGRGDPPNATSYLWKSRYVFPEQTSTNVHQTYINIWLPQDGSHTVHTHNINTVSHRKVACVPRQCYNMSPKHMVCRQALACFPDKRWHVSTWNICYNMFAHTHRNTHNTTWAQADINVGPNKHERTFPPQITTGLPASHSICWKQTLHIPYFRGSVEKQTLHSIHIAYVEHA